MVALGLPVALISGCVSYEPKPLDPRTELAALNARELPTGRLVTLLPAVPGTAGPLTFDLSDGMSEAELMAIAVTLNPDLQAARASVGETEALLIAARTLPNPEIGVGFGIGLLGTNGFKLDTDLLFELLKPGERAARQAVASARIVASRAEVLAKEYEVAAETRRLVFDVLVTEQTIAVLDAELSLRQQAADLLRRRRGVGEANDLDVSAVDLELVEVQRDRRLAGVELEQAKLALNRVAGLPPQTVIPLELSGKPLDIPIFEGFQAGELDERILSARLDLKAREADYQVAEEALRHAVSRQYAKLKVGPLYEHEGVSENFAGIAASVEIPIFDRNQGEIAERTAARDRVRAEYIADLHRLRSSAAAALARVRATRAEIDAQNRDILPLLERSQTLARGAFEARELSVLDWVTAQQRSLRTRRAYLDTVIAYRRALLEMEALGGFPVWKIAPEPYTTTPLDPSSDRSES
jgi:outer membrane protein, heavy metal efflux system